MPLIVFGNGLNGLAARVTVCGERSMSWQAVAESSWQCGDITPEELSCKTMASIVLPVLAAMP